MSVKYIPFGNAKIVVDKVTYQNQGEKKAALPADKIGKEELEKLLKMKLIKKLVFDESGSVNKGVDKKREALLKEAGKLGIVFTDEATNEEIRQAITDAKARKKLIEKALELGLDVSEKMSAEDIQQLITEAEAKQ